MRQQAVTSPPSVTLATGTDTHLRSQTLADGTGAGVPYFFILTNERIELQIYFSKGKNGDK